MGNVSEVAGTASQGVTGFFTNLFASVALWQVALVAAILLILVIIFICALVAKNHRYDDLVEEKEKQSYAAQRADKESREALSDKEDELLRTRRDNEQALAEAQKEAEQVIGEKAAQIDDLKEKVDELTRFRNEYVAIPNAKAEAARIVREAKDHAYVVSNRTEMEYAEIIEHANQEAEAIRGLAQQRLTRSHDALRQALARANEIVEEAHAEATRLAKINYVPGPGLIEAPTEENPVEEAPSEFADAIAQARDLLEEVEEAKEEEA